MKRYIALIVLLMSMVSFSQELNEITWPREIENDKGTVVTLYQPQLESFENNILVGRMALSVKVKDKDLIFGALWFSATLISNLE